MKQVPQAGTDAGARHPGKNRSLLEAARAAQGVRAQIPVLTVTGAKAGPTAVIMAGQHGRELNGIAAIEQVFESLDPARLKGTVVFLPVMNPVAIRMHEQDFPTEAGRYRPIRASVNMNMNRAWSLEGMREPTYVSAVAEAVWETYLRQADFGMDLHGWSGLSLCLAWAHRRDVEYLRAFGLPWSLVIDQAQHRGLTEDAAGERRMPWITCELTPHNQVVPESVAFGVRGILNALRFHGMLAGRLECPPVQYEFAEKHVETIICTPVEGLVVGDCRKGDWVKEGERVLRVLSLETLETVFEFRAPHDALVFNIGGTHWGEDIPESFVVFPGQIVGLLKKPTRILRPAERTAENA